MRFRFCIFFRKTSSKKAFKLILTTYVCITKNLALDYKNKNSKHV